MKKRILSVLLAVMLAVTAGITLIGCGGGKGDLIVDNEYTLNVKLRKAGYGTTFLTEIAKKFETTYVDEGYKINILPPVEDLVGDKVAREIYANSKVDVFFSDTLEPTLTVQGSYGQVAADITESVYNQKPIKFDGTEEAETIKDKLGKFESTRWVLDGKIYGLPYAASVGGLVVNKKVLDDQGLDVPRTTNELMKTADKIMEKALETDIFPFTYAFADNLYTNSILGSWMAQASGEDIYDQFWSFQDAEGNDMLKDSYKVFNTQGLKEAIEVLFNYMDPNMMSYGSATHDVFAAQGQIMKGDAVFYACGDWMFNEEYTKYPNNLDDVIIIKAPMISTVGVEFFADNGFDKDKCDDILSLIVKYAEENKSEEEIKVAVEKDLSVSLDIDDVKGVCERYGYTRNSVNLGCIVNENSEKKDLAALFLRFIASTDAGELFAKEARTPSPYAFNAKIPYSNPWFESVYKITSNRYYNQLATKPSGYRQALGLGDSFFPTGNHIYIIDIADKKVSKYDPYDLTVMSGTQNIYKEAAEDFCNTAADKAKEKLEKNEWKVKS